MFIGVQGNVNQYRVFFKNTATLGVGTAVAQVIPFLLTPVVARLYCSRDMGFYSLYLSTVNILTQGACFKYEMAIVSCETEWEAEQIARLCAVVLTAMALLSAGVGAITGFYFLRFTGGNIWGYSVLLALGVGAIGWFSVLSNRCIFYKKYKALAFSSFIRAAVYGGLQVMLFPLGGSGLIAAQVGGYICACIVLRYKLPSALRESSKKLLNKRKVKAWKDTMVKYRAFPLYTMPGAAANTAALGQISFWASWGYSSQELGGYAMVDRVLSLPLSLISNAVGQVFFKQAAEEYKNTGKINSFPRVWAALAVLSVIGFGGLSLCLPWAVSLFLGPKWLGCIGYSRRLLPLYGIRFACAPLLFTAVVMGKQKAMMAWQVGTLLFAAAAFYQGVSSKIAFESFLTQGALVLAGAYVFFAGICCFWAVKGKTKENKSGETKGETKCR